MTKVGRAFTLDQRVSERLDEVTSVPGRSKPMNKSRYVNEALQWYMDKNLAEYQKDVIESRNFLVSNINEKRLIIGGLEANIASLEEQIMAGLVCQCLWCRLKRLLKRSRVEQQEQ